MNRITYLSFKVIELAGSLNMVVQVRTVVSGDGDDIDIVEFDVYPDKIMRDGVVIHEGPAILRWEW